MESAVQSVWDTIRSNGTDRKCDLNDTATSDSVWASDEAETTTKLLGSLLGSH